jgi:hypothetical protein
MKTKSILGLIAGVILLLSAFAHSILGWKAMSDQLAQTNAPPDLVQGRLGVRRSGHAGPGHPVHLDFP